nr:MAG TPA: hypothetical protein [Caudoviricetes sp.]
MTSFYYKNTSKISKSLKKSLILFIIILLYKGD